jgi:hypothetical protein
MNVLRQQTSHLLLIRTSLGYVILLTAVCARQGCSATDYFYYYININVKNNLDIINNLQNIFKRHFYFYVQRWALQTTYLPIKIRRGLPYASSLIIWHNTCAWHKILQRAEFRFLQNVGNYLHNHTASQPKNQNSDMALAGYVGEMKPHFLNSVL